MLDEMIMSMLAKKPHSINDLYEEISKSMPRYKIIDVIEALGRLKLQSKVMNKSYMYYLPGYDIDNYKEEYISDPVIDSAPSKTHNNTPRNTHNLTPEAKENEYDKDRFKRKNYPFIKLSGIVIDYIKARGPQKLKDLQIYLNQNYIEDNEIIDLIGMLPVHIKKMCEINILVKDKDGTYKLPSS